MFDSPLFLLRDCHQPDDLFDDACEALDPIARQKLVQPFSEAPQSVAMPWLTVVMPIHHGEHWLEATFDSILASDTSGIEFLFIDSSPNNLSQEIAERYLDRLDIVISCRPDLKQWTDKTNHGVAMARAEHVVMLHQDDVWLPNRGAMLRDWIATAPNASVQFAPTAIINSSGRRLGTWRCPLDEGSLVRDVLLERLLVQCFVSVPAPVFRRDAFLSSGGMRSNLWYTADWDLWLKLASVGPTIYRRAVTTGFRVHSQSLTIMGSRERGDFEKQLQEVLDRHTTVDAPPSRLAKASVQINVELAKAAAGSGLALCKAIGVLIALGPVSLARYLRYSRLFERCLPRIRAGLAYAR